MSVSRYESRNAFILQEFLKRDALIPGYAIGGLAGGEDKESFCRVVSLFPSSVMCRLSSVPGAYQRTNHAMSWEWDILQISQSVQLSVLICMMPSERFRNRYDCVYPTRTGRFGNAFVPSGLMKLKANIYKYDERPIDENCQCNTCKVHRSHRLYSSVEFHSFYAAPSREGSGAWVHLYYSS